MGAHNRQTRRGMHRHAIRAYRAAYGLNRRQARLLAYKPTATPAKALFVAMAEATASRVKAASS